MISGLSEARLILTAYPSWSLVNPRLVSGQVLFHTIPNQTIHQHTIHTTPYQVLVHTRINHTIPSISCNTTHTIPSFRLIGTCASVRPRLAANCLRSGFVIYFWIWNLKWNHDFLAPSFWYFEIYTAICTFPTSFQGLSFAGLRIRLSSRTSFSCSPQKLDPATLAEDPTLDIRALERKDILHTCFGIVACFSIQTLNVENMEYSRRPSRSPG